MQTSGLHILKNLWIFGLLTVFGIMEADSAALDDFLEQEVCARVGLLGGLCELTGSRDSERPRARTRAPLWSPVGPTKSSGHGGYFVPDEFWCSLCASSSPFGVLGEGVGSGCGENPVTLRHRKSRSSLIFPY